MQIRVGNAKLLGAILLFAEYGVTIGLALLSGYWIVYGRW